MATFNYGKPYTTVKCGYLNQKDRELDYTKKSDKNTHHQIRFWILVFVQLDVEDGCDQCTRASCHMDWLQRCCLEYWRLKSHFVQFQLDFLIFRKKSKEIALKSTMI